jgi:hypothetical protein
MQATVPNQRNVSENAKKCVQKVTKIIVLLYPDSVKTVGRLIPLLELSYF